jgi:hypothetical protein
MPPTFTASWDRSTHARSSIPTCGRLFATPRLGIPPTRCIQARAKRLKMKSRRA